MIPNDPARVPPRLVPAQQMVARDITREFVNAASSASLFPRGLLFRPKSTDQLEADRRI